MERIVRSAAVAEASELAAVASVTFPLACPPSTTAEAIAAFIAENLTAERFLDYLADPRRLVLAILDEERIIGYSMLVAGEPYDADVAARLRIAPTVELSKLYVLPGHHGTGAAGFLLRAALDVAGPFGAASGIWLGTNQQNVRAQRFYEKHGFVRVGVKRFLVGGRYEDDYVYERALESPQPGSRSELRAR